MDLVRWLTERQRELGLTDEGFARRLGVSPSYLSLLRSGKRHPTWTIIRNTVRAFPEHRGTIISLALDIRSSKASDTTGTLEEVAV